VTIARHAARLFGHGALALLACAAALELAVRSVDLPDPSRLTSNASLLVAEDGSTLGGYLSPDEKWRFTPDLGAIDATYLDMMIAYEDRNFRTHKGVDVGAAMRAAGQALRHRRIVSGASTLTMQLTRLLDPRSRGLEAKVLEALRAVKLERHLTKDEILSAYLSVAPFGGNIEGVRAASLIYLGKEPRDLSLAEAALLVALPQAPETRRPDRSPGAARAARDRVLSSLAARGVIPPQQAAYAAQRQLTIKGNALPQHAFHLGLRQKPEVEKADRETIPTLIDRRLQIKAEEIARAALGRWDTGVNISIVVIRNEDGAVVGYVGSGAPGSRARDGYVDLAQAVRSPGSALKPFIYAMAFEKLIVHPDTIVADQPIDLAGYRPDNADGVYSGDISMRQALILSKNTVPVMLLDAVGIPAFLGRFRTVGDPLRLAASDSEAGLAVALGGIGVSPLQLTWFYSAFANEGELKALRFAPADKGRSFGNLFTPAAANAVADILADVPPPAGRARLAAQDGSRRIGFKTGTSYGFRDAWAVGFDKEHTVGVWIGRPDGAPHLGAYGVTAAAPVMMKVFDALPAPRKGAASGRKPLGALASPRSLPERLRRFGPATASEPLEPLEIIYPRPGAQIAAQRDEGETFSLPLKVAGGRPPYRWTVLGNELAPEPTAEHWASIAARGQIDIAVTDADGKVDRASFWFE
jgi:penicillin-binding protein 1C